MSLVMIEPVILYKMGARHLQVWHMHVTDTTLVIQHGVECGALQTHLEQVDMGKGGRTHYQQVKSRFESRVNKQLLLGYKVSREEALKGPSNALGLVQPMLAQVYGKVKVDISDALIQYKYDGNRCLITKQDGELVAYSRRGKVIKNLSHILDGIKLLEGETIDGELYAHGATLQEIVSWVRRTQPGTKRVKFQAYDIVSKDPYAKRLLYLQSLSLGDNAEVVPTKHISEVESIDSYFNQARDEGYEGLILRVGSTGYEKNKRSKSLLKVKAFMDSIAVVEHIYLSDREVPMADCGTFKVTLPGTFEEKDAIYDKRFDYIGRVLEYKFSGYTKDNIPFQPIALRFRDDV